MPPPSAPHRPRVCGEVIEPGKKLPVPSWSLVWKEKPMGMGERSGAGAVGRMPVRRDAPPETPALENILVAGSRSWGKKKCRSQLQDTGNSVWGRGYTEKDLAAVAAACSGMRASSAAAWGAMDEQSSSGCRGLRGCGGVCVCCSFWGQQGGLR